MIFAQMDSKNTKSRQNAGTISIFLYFCFRKNYKLLRLRALSRIMIPIFDTWCFSSLKENRASTLQRRRSVRISVQAPTTVLI